MCCSFHHATQRNGLLPPQCQEYSKERYHVKLSKLSSKHNLIISQSNNIDARLDSVTFISETNHQFLHIFRFMRCLLHHHSHTQHHRFEKSVFTEHLVHSPDCCSSNHTFLTAPSYSVFALIAL